MIYRFSNCKVKTRKEDTLPFHSKYRETMELQQKTIGALTYEEVYNAYFHHRDYIEVDRSLKDVETKLIRNNVGLYLIEVEIEQKSYRFLLDTGAQISVIKKEIAKDLDIKVYGNEVQVGSIGGAQKGSRIFQMPKIRFAGQEIRNLPMLMMEGLRLEIPVIQYDVLKIDGILGWNALSMFDFEIDEPNERFRILTKKKWVGYHNLIPSVFPTLLVEDKKGDLKLFGIDTGARLSWLSYEYMRSYDKEHIRTQKKRGFGVHGMETLEGYAMKQWEGYVYKARIRIRWIMSNRVDLLPGITYDGVLGNDIFEGRKIRFLNSIGMLLFK